MKKDNVLFITLLSAIVVVIILCGYFAFRNEKVFTETDAFKIKEEYASYNKVVNESNKREYPYVELSDQNPFVYKSEEDVISLLESGTGVIYFGFPNCPWCRSMLPILEKAAQETGLGEIYYLNIYDIRSTLSIDENNKIITEKAGSSGYYKILKLLDSYLGDYTLKKNDKTFDTDEKRLYAPTVVVVQDGEIKGFHEGTVDTQESGYDPLSDEEKTNLQNIFQDMIRKIELNTCTDGC